MSGYVYFLRAESGEVKIGYATDVTRRVRQLQRASPAYLTLLGCRPGTRADEATFHQHFAAQRLHGEWFASSAKLLANAWLVDADGSSRPFTLSEAAEVMGLRRETIAREIRLGSLKCGLDAGGRPRISPEQIDDWVWYDLPKEQRT